MENQELREVFFAEAVEIKDALDRILTTLERQPQEPMPLLAEAFRHLHTLKGNATAMGISALANLTHVLEDLLACLQKKPTLLNTNIINELLRANDKIADSLLAWKEDRPLVVRGLITKLQVLLREWEAGEQAGRETGEQEDGEQENEEVEEQTGKEVGSNLIQVSETISVATRKLDYLLDLVGELSIENDRLANNFSSKELSRLQRLTAELHHAVLHTRLVQVQDLWQKFHRLVRDTAQAEQKQVELILEGTDTEIDRKILPVLTESLLHLIRNAIGHGIETSPARQDAQKSAVGKLWLRASGYRDRVLIEVQDDGRGISPAHIREAVVRKGLMTAENAQRLTDEQALQTIFMTGFSSAETVSNISGRGVGLDVVKNSVEAIGGQVLITTEVGKGTTFTLELPSSIALKPVMLFEAENITWAIPIDYVVDIAAYQRTDLQRVGDRYWIKKGDTIFPIVVPAQILQRLSASQFLENMPPHAPLLIIRLNDKGQDLGIVADKLLQQKEIFEKPLAPPLSRLRLVSGTSILGNGLIALTLDVRQWFDFFFETRASNGFTKQANKSMNISELHIKALQASTKVIASWLHEPIEIEGLRQGLMTMPESCYIFTTEVTGDWQAVSWLVCAKDQMQAVWQARQAGKPPTEASQMMQLAFLSELDNIVCAHFIATIDQTQGTKALGAAPTYGLWHKAQALPAHSEVWSCTLRGTQTGIALGFIWFW